MQTVLTLIHYETLNVKLFYDRVDQYQFPEMDLSVVSKKKKYRRDKNRVSFQRNAETVVYNVRRII